MMLLVDGLGWLGWNGLGEAAKTGSQRCCAGAVSCAHPKCRRETGTRAAGCEAWAGSSRLKEGFGRRRSGSRKAFAAGAAASRCRLPPLPGLSKAPLHAAYAVLQRPADLPFRRQRGVEGSIPEPAAGVPRPQLPPSPVAGDLRSRAPHSHAASQPPRNGGVPDLARSGSGEERWASLNMNLDADIQWGALLRPAPARRSPAPPRQEHGAP